MNNRHQACFIAIFVLLVAVGGCGFSRGGNNASTHSPVPAAAGGITAAAVDSVAEPMRPFFAAGLGFLVIGGLAAAWGGRAGGLLLMGLGAATTAVGVLFVQFPWVVLPLLLVAMLAAGLALWDRMRARRELLRSQDVLAATAQVIQNTPEGKAIKTGLAQLGKNVEERVREVIDPIKERLRNEGKITS